LDGAHSLARIRIVHTFNAGMLCDASEGILGSGAREVNGAALTRGRAVRVETR